ncbi:MAG TPA: cation:proton antiporter [Humibacter sp.]|nr:cation:proton antiporter [Humibacter sp.]
MTGIEPLASEILLISLALIAAVMSNRLSAAIRVPAPALFLIAAALLAKLVPALSSLPRSAAENLVTIALVFILFDGGMDIGWKRFRDSLGTITWLGVVGTLVTAAAIAAAAYFLFGFDLRLALLLGAAISPTDPAVVFSVLGKREIAGRTGTILQGESGANDPVGISLLVSLLAATGTGFPAVWSGLTEFLLQLTLGAAIGIIGGLALTKLMRTISLPNEALHSVGTVAFATLIYGAATVLQGSGFLAVLLAGIVVGDSYAPFKSEIRRFSSGLAAIGEIAAFSILGLSVSLSVVFQPAVIWSGLAIAALLIFVIRPVLVGLLLIPIRLRWGERVFVLWGGLKGAVPILLGMFILGAKIPGGDRVYAIIFVVVLVSVVLQGGLVPLFARLLAVRMRVVEPQPWASGLRFRERPDGLGEYVVAAGSVADGVTVDALELGDDGWISLVRRDGRLVQVRGSTTLQAGDVVLALGEGNGDLDRLFRSD